MENPPPELFLYVYDELAESRVRLRRKDYETFLVKWGVDAKMAERVCAAADRDDDGYITRDMLCKGLNCWPNKPEVLKHTKVIRCDMPIRKRESLICLICDCAKRQKSKEELPQEILKRIEPIYGKGWTIYVTDGHVWAMQVHQPGSNLVFAYKGNVYGLYQCPVGK